LTAPPRASPYPCRADVEETRHELTVVLGEEDRLDSYIASKLGLSRTRSQKLVASGFVLIDGRPAKKSELVVADSRVAVRVPAPVVVSIEAEDIPLEIVFQDDVLVVVNKPAGMVVHPGPGHHSGTMVNALMHHIRDLSGVGGRLRPGIVHRLDQDTSGLLVVAKNDEAHLALSDALRRRKVKRLYQTAVWGHISESPVTIEAPIGRDPKDRKRMSVNEDGRPALTRVRLRERWERADFLDVALKTGRTHQIRVHLTHVGHPVVGDAVYGLGWERGMGGPTRSWAVKFSNRVPRQFLHAAELTFDHPLSGERLRFQAPLPEDLAKAASWARGDVA